MENSESPITLSSGQVVAVWTVSGVVADDQHSNSTRVYSSGGGGFVGPNGGHVSAPEVHSETTTRQSVWITDGASKDHQISLRNVGAGAGRRRSPHGEHPCRLASEIEDPRCGGAHNRWGPDRGVG